MSRSESDQRSRFAGPWVVLGMVLIVGALGFVIWWSSRSEPPETKPATPTVEDR